MLSPVGETAQFFGRVGIVNFSAELHRNNQNEQAGQFVLFYLMTSVEFCTESLIYFTSKQSGSISLQKLLSKLATGHIMSHVESHVGGHDIDT